MLSSLVTPCASIAPCALAGHRQLGRQLARHIRKARVQTTPKRLGHGATSAPVVLAAAGLAQEIEKKNAENAVVVYSKTYCTCCAGLYKGMLHGNTWVYIAPPVRVSLHTGPYCSQVKSLFGKLGVPAKVVELDELGTCDGVYPLCMGCFVHSFALQANTQPVHSTGMHLLTQRMGQTFRQHCRASPGALPCPKCLSVGSLLVGVTVRGVVRGFVVLPTDATPCATPLHPTLENPYRHDGCTQ